MLQVKVKPPKTRAKSALHELRHPLPPEILVAEFAGELPPDVARAVRAHISSCESCGARARALSTPYQLVAALGDEPVTYVPDLRRPVRETLGRWRLVARLSRAAGTLGRGSVPMIALALGILILVSLALVGNAFEGGAPVTRSTNGLAHVPAAGPSGLIFVETGKLITMTTRNGIPYDAAEVIAVDERTGRVVRSLPASTAAPRGARLGDLPAAVALAPDGQTVYEITNGAQQALLAFDAVSGQPRFAQPLAMPGGQALPVGVRAVGLAMAPDGGQAYVSLSLGGPGLAGPRALVVSVVDGSITGVLEPGLPATVPLPPVANGPSLTGVTPPSSQATLATTGLSANLAAGGTLAIAPDGRTLFDVVALTGASGPTAAVVRQFDATSGTTLGALALPGDYTLSALAASTNPQQALVYLVRGGFDEHLYILGAADLTLSGDLPLGGLAAAPGVTLSGRVALSPTQDGGAVYVSMDITGAGTTAGGLVAGHDLWLVNATSATVASHVHQFQDVGAAYANWAGGPGGQVLLLRGTDLDLLPAALGLNSNPPAFLSLSDGTPVETLLGTTP
jgi:hypothetical protein